MSAFDVAKKYLKTDREPPAVWSDPNIASTRIEDGEIIAVEVCSAVLETHIWLAFDDGFDPGDGIPIFYADELELLKNKPVATLRKIYETKKSFGKRTRVRQ